MASDLAGRFKRITVKTVPVYLAIVLLIAFSQPKLPWLIPGLALILVGELLRIWAAGHLRKTKEVTTTGPYAYVKNPLYLGTFLILVGFCLMAGNLWILAAGAAIFVVYYAPFKKKREGQRLFEKFGDAWADYDLHVPDYIPRWSPYPGRGGRKWSWRDFRENSEDGTFLAVVLGVLLILLRFLF
jgi:protein-S-isoprenylcysteine O-methyltransferase Ste14